MIPKIIHYCWFGRNPIPAEYKRYIESWKKFLPDYEIKEWNESNFDVNIIPYTAEAYKAKKYAFVSDYARFWIFYKYGGLYFDTDVEVIKNMDDIIAKGPFMGCENEAKAGATPVQLGVAPGRGLYKEILDDYDKSHFLKETGEYNMKTVVWRTVEILSNHGLQNVSSVQYVAGVYIYPKEYFCPKNYRTGQMVITQNTRSIHWYDASWVSKERKIKNWLYANSFTSPLMCFLRRTFLEK